VGGPCGAFLLSDKGLTQIKIFNKCHENMRLGSFWWHARVAIATEISLCSGWDLLWQAHCLLGDRITCDACLFGKQQRLQNSWAKRMQFGSKPCITIFLSKSLCPHHCMCTEAFQSFRLEFCSRLMMKADRQEENSRQAV